MFKIKVIGNYSLNLEFLQRFFLLFKTERKYPCSCYVVLNEKEKKAVILDMGIGTLKTLLKYLKEKNILLKNITIILSHNHADHSFEMIKVCYKVWFKNVINLFKNLYTSKNKKVEKLKIKVYLPQKSIMYYFIKFFPQFDERIINNNTKFEFNGFKMTFCKTNHRGESYATKIVEGNKSFIYTSDIYSTNKEILGFCKDADTILIDAGFPKKCERISLPGYHGKTDELIKNFDMFNIKNIILSHLKTNLEEFDYFAAIPKYTKANIKITKKGEEIIID